MCYSPCSTVCLARLEIVQGYMQLLSRHRNTASVVHSTLLHSLFLTCSGLPQQCLQSRKDGQVLHGHYAKFSSVSFLRIGFTKSATTEQDSFEVCSSTRIHTTKELRTALMLSGLDRLVFKLWGLLLL